MLHNPTSARTGSTRLKASQRRPQVLELRLEGQSIRTIAEHLDCSPTTVLNDLNTVLEDLQRQTRESAEQYLTMELDRLDALQVALWDAAMNGDVSSVDRVLKIMERRAKLLGLDAPHKVAQTTPDGKESYQDMSEEELDKRIAELQAKLAEEDG